MIKRLLLTHSPLVILAGLCVVLGVISEDFRSPGNLQDVAMRTSFICIIAIGELLVILTAGIDLSIGSVAAFAGVAGTLLMTKQGVPAPLAILLGTAAGGLCGAINGLLVTKGRIPPFIVTLGMMLIARGAALILTDAKPVYNLPDAFDYIGGTKGWYVPVCIMLGVVAFFTVLLAFTRYGRSIYATGGNRGAARLSGIPTDRVRFSAYLLSGLLAGFGGMMLASYIGIGSPTEAEMYELDAIAACVIGGTSLMGGEGGAPGVLAGALIMQVLVNFCNLEDISIYWQRVLVGTLIIALVAYDNYRKRRAGLLKEV